LATLLTFLPPTIRAELVQFAERLRDGGVDVDIKEYPKAPHVRVDGYGARFGGIGGWDDLVKIVRETLANSKQFLELNPSDLNNEPDRRNLLEQAKRPHVSHVVAWSHDGAKRLGTSVVSGLAPGVAHSL
jgi:hypothetical protein